jgi:hypothetical protein
MCHSFSTMPSFALNVSQFQHHSKLCSQCSISLVCPLIFRANLLENRVSVLLSAALKPQLLQWALWLRYGLCISGFESCQAQEKFRWNNQIFCRRTSVHRLYGNRTSSGRGAGHSPLSVPRLKMSGSVPILPLRSLGVYKNNTTMCIIYIGVHSHSYTHTHTHTHIYICTYIYVHTCLHTYTHTHTWNIYTYILASVN